MRRSMSLTVVGVLALVALNGCARRPARTTGAPPRMTKLESLAGPHFAYNTSDLTPEGRAKVRGLAATLNKYPDRRVDVYGYTDSNGSDAHNQLLSERRADTVKQALIEDGVSASRISTRGEGASNPVASNATAEGRAQNRRVEIILE
jgi:OmpA-OmpF porin, OOP family